MARGRARTISRPIIIPRAAPPRRRSTGLARLRAKAKIAARRGASRARQMAGRQKHRIVSIAAAGGFGLARRFMPELMDKFTFGPFGPEFVIGAIATALSEFGPAKGNEMLSHVGTTGLSLGTFLWAGGFTVSGLPNGGPDGMVYL